MGDVVASPVILLPVFPVCLTAIRDANLRSPEQIGVFRRSEFSVKEIFTGDHNGDRYYYAHRQEIRPVARAEVEKMLSCKGPGRGCFVYYCPTCFRTISFGCNSRLCSECGKRYTDQWAKRLGKARFDVPHRHAVLTLPDRLRGVLKEDRGLWKVIVDSAIKALHDEILSFYFNMWFCLTTRTMFT